MEFLDHMLVFFSIFERLLAYPFSRGSSQPRNWTVVSYIACRFFTSRFFTSWATREAPILFCIVAVLLTPTVQKDPFPPHIHQHLLFIVFLIMAILASVRWYFTVIVISISLIGKRPLEAHCVYFFICNIFFQLGLNVFHSYGNRPPMKVYSVSAGIFWDIFGRGHGKPLLSVICILDRQYIICLFRQEVKIKNVVLLTPTPLWTPDVLLAFFSSTYFFGAEN